MDQKLLFLINHEWTCPALDRLMAIMSSGALWTVPIVLLVIAVGVRAGFKGRAFLVVTLIAIGMSDGLFGKNIKAATGRLRPHQSEVGVRTLDLARPAWRGLFQPLKEKNSLGTGLDQPGKSFPSNHAANTTAASLIAALLWRRRGWLAFIPALIVSYSRVYTGAHWPSDVFAGICVGLASGLLALLIAEWAWRRWGARIAPRIASQNPTILSA